MGLYKFVRPPLLEVYHSVTNFAIKLLMPLALTLLLLLFVYIMKSYFVYFCFVLEVLISDI